MGMCSALRCMLRSCMPIVASTTALVFLSSACGANGDESLRAGSWSIQFGVDKNLTLKPLGGFSLSVKRHFSAKSAIGLVATLTGEKGSMDPEANDDRERRNVDQGDFEISLSPIYVIYPNPDGALRLVLGIGPDFLFGTHDSYLEWRYSGDTEYEWRKESYSYKVYSAGINGLIGAEWFFTERMSLFANYGSSLRFEYVEREDTSGKSSRIRRTWRDYELCEIRTELGISLYF